MQIERVLEPYNERIYEATIFTFGGKRKKKEKKKIFSMRKLKNEPILFHYFWRFLLTGPT